MEVRKEKQVLGRTLLPGILQEGTSESCPEGKERAVCEEQCLRSRLQEHKRNGGTDKSGEVEDRERDC